MNIRLMKALDALIGKAAVRIIRPIPTKASADLFSFLVIRPGGIGDAVLLVPAIQAIKKKIPAAKITVLAEKRNAAVFNLCPEVDHLLLYDKPTDLFSVLGASYDVVIDTEQWHRLSAVVARFTRTSLMIGYATNERARLFTHQINYSHDEYEGQSFKNLLVPLGIGPALSEDVFLNIPEDAIKKAEQKLATMAGKPLVTMFPGASILERRWGADQFSTLAQLLARVGVSVVVVGGAGDREQGEKIISKCVGFNLAGKTSLAETAAIIDKSALLISGDSGVLHLAVGLGKPTVSMFGPGRSKKWAPRGDRHIVINKDLPCSPCTVFGNTPECPVNARCMKEITVDEVYDAVMTLLT